MLDLFTVCGRVSIAGTTKKAESPRARVRHAIFRHEKSHVRRNVIRMMSVVRSWHRFDKVPSTEESQRLSWLSRIHRRDPWSIADLDFVNRTMINAFLYAFCRKKLNWIILLRFFSSSPVFLTFNIYLLFIYGVGIQTQGFQNSSVFNPLNSICFQCCCIYI